MPETTTLTQPLPDNMDTLLKGLWRENPVFVQVLGMCPVLAVTNTVVNSLVMGLATTFVLVMSNISVAAFRNVIPKQVRIASYIRELLGSGTFAGLPVFGPSFEPWVVMVLPAGAFFVLGGWLLLISWMRERRRRRRPRKQLVNA